MTDAAEQRKAQTTATFNLLAPDYDAAGVGCFAHFGRRLVEQVGIERGQAALDVATGRGALLVPAAEHVGPEGRVVGIDLAYPERYATVLTTTGAVHTRIPMVRAWTRLPN